MTSCADAGAAQTVFLESGAFLAGAVAGVDPADPRLAVVWRQVDPDPTVIKASIAAPASLVSRVTFSKTGEGIV